MTPLIIGTGDLSQVVDAPAYDLTFDEFLNANPGSPIGTYTIEFVSFVGLPSSLDSITILDFKNYIDLPDPSPNSRKLTIIR